MHALFNIASPTQSGVLKYPNWNYLRDGFQRSLGLVLGYYRKNPIAVRSSHFLVRLLQSITVPQSHGLERYWANVDEIALNLSMTLKMTSSISSGHLFPGIFYGQGNDEILIAHSDSFDIFEAHANWKDLTPVTVISHPMSDLSLNLPNGNNSRSESGLAVISINIPMLAVQYRAFRMNEIYVTGGGDSQRSIMQFIHMFVLPNMLPSHLDYALFNRLNNMEKGAPLGEALKANSFFLTKFENKVDTIYQQLLGNIGKNNYDFTTTLRSVPMVSAESANEALELPDIASTRQVAWALAAARIDVLDFLFRTAKYGAGQRNQLEVNRILIALKAYKSNNLMKNLLPPEVYYDIQDKLDRIESLANS